jgi:signal transduction histidine kinase
MRFLSFWRWWSTVRSDDPVRQALNHGFAIVLLIAVPLTITLALIDAMQDHMLALFLHLLALPLMVPPLYLNRRGHAGSAVLMGAFLAITAPFFYPVDIHMATNDVPLQLAATAVIVTLFVNPRAGFVACVAQWFILLLGVLFAGTPSGSIKWLANVAAHTVGITGVLAVGASMLRRFIYDLSQINATLEQHVAARTAELAAANAFIERRAGEQAKQVSAVVHDLRHTATAVDSVLSLLELEVEDAEAAITVIATEAAAVAMHDQHLPALIGAGGSTHTRWIDGTADIDGHAGYASAEHPAVGLVNQATAVMRALLEHLVRSGEAIRTALDGQHGLLSDILDMAQLEADAIVLQPAVVDLQAIVRRVSRLFELQAAYKRCTITIATNEPTVAWCDGRRIERVLCNIMGNALKYTSAYRTDGNGQIRMEVAQEAAWSVCRVTDNGPGIAAEDLVKLGERFQRAERSIVGEGGTGLGLHFCKGVLEAGGGELRMTSEGLGCGATITIRLPSATNLRGRE